MQENLDSEVLDSLKQACDTSLEELEFSQMYRLEEEVMTEMVTWLASVL